MTDLIIIIIDLGFLYFLFIYSVDFYKFINTDIPGLILSLISILFYKELLSSFLFILLDNLLVNSKDKFHRIKCINRSVYIRDLILDIIL